MAEFPEIDWLFVVADIWLQPILMLAAGIGALAGLMGARLLSAACIGAGAIGAGALTTGFDLAALMPELRIGLIALAFAGTVEILVIAIGGRAAVPTFWATVLAALLAFVFFAPFKKLVGGLTALILKIRP